MYLKRSISKKPTACLVLDDGTTFYGEGFGTVGEISAELCFNTSMIGYQEISTDPSYAGQIVTFTFPHIGNVGVTSEDEESFQHGAEAIVVRWQPTAPSNWRAVKQFNLWMKERGRMGIGGVDTRYLTQIIRRKGAPHGTICHNPAGHFNIKEQLKKARAFPGLKGLDLADRVSTGQSYRWNERRWAWPEGFKKSSPGDAFKVVALDYGIKRTILRCLIEAGCNVTVLPAKTSATQILEHKPDGVFLSNGPGDPMATGIYAVPMIQEILNTSDIPIFGICLGHQMLALALGAKTIKMNHGHHGANHPVKVLESGKVEITSMNHGFAVDSQSLPQDVIETHISLFDGSNCGIKIANKPVFSVQYHPEASPGPQDSYNLFDNFVEMMRAHKTNNKRLQNA